MPVTTEQGVFQINTSLGNQTINLADTGMIGNVVLFWGSSRTNDTSSPPQKNFFGFGEAGRGRSISCSADNVTPSDVRSRWASVAIQQSTIGSNSVEYEAEVVSFSAGEFVIDVQTPPATAYDIHYMVISGLTNVGIGNVTNLADTLGNQSETGLGFQGDVIIAASINQSISSNNTVTSYMMNIGVAVSSTKRGSTFWYAEHNSAGQVTGRRQRADQFLLSTNTVGDINGIADFVSFDADGFTINVSDAWDNRLIYIVMKGGQWDVSAFNSLGFAGTQKVNTPFQPVGAMAFSFCDTTRTTASNNVDNSIGGSSGPSNNGCIIPLNQFNSSNCHSAQDKGHIYENRLSSNGSTQGSIKVDSFDVDGITLEETDGDSDANEIILLSVGNPVVVGGQLVDRNPLFGNKLIGGTLIG